MNKFMASIQKHRSGKLSEKKQVSAGTPIIGSVEEEHKNFLRTLFHLLDTNQIDPYDQKSFLKMDVYNSLDESWQDKVDLSLSNIANQIRLIDDMRHSSTDETIHLQTMVEQLWQMKQRIEEHHDVFLF